MRAKREDSCLDRYCPSATAGRCLRTPEVEEQLLAGREGTAGRAVGDAIEQVVTERWHYQSSLTDLPYAQSTKKRCAALYMGPADAGTAGDRLVAGCPGLADERVDSREGDVRCWQKVADHTIDVLRRRREKVDRLDARIRRARVADEFNLCKRRASARTRSRPSPRRSRERSKGNGAREGQQPRTLDVLVEDVVHLEHVEHRSTRRLVGDDRLPSRGRLHPADRLEEACGRRQHVNDTAAVGARQQHGAPSRRDAPTDARGRGSGARARLASWPRFWRPLERR